jgi:hypothetical protein
MRLSGKTYCLIAISSRLLLLHDNLVENISLVSALCSIYDVAFSLACVSTGKTVFT